MTPQQIMIKLATTTAMEVYQLLQAENRKKFSDKIKNTEFYLKDVTRSLSYLRTLTLEYHKVIKSQNPDPGTCRHLTQELSITIQGLCENLKYTYPEKFEIFDACMAELLQFKTTDKTT